MLSSAELPNRDTGRKHSMCEADCLEGLTLRFITVIAKQGLTGNCRRRNWKGSSESDGTRGILGRRTTSPLKGPHDTVTSMKF